MQDQAFTIYKEEYVTLKGSVAGGCLELESHVYGDDDFAVRNNTAFPSRKLINCFK